MWQIAYDVTQFVSRHHGTLPVVLSCPDDGAESPPNVPERARRSCPQTATSPKSLIFTRVLSRCASPSLLNTCGEAPCVVVADFHRKYIDANRIDANAVSNCAYEVSVAKQFYDEYHQTLSLWTRSVRKAANWGGASEILRCRLR